MDEDTEVPANTGPESTTSNTQAQVEDGKSQASDNGSCKTEGKQGHKGIHLHRHRRNKSKHEQEVDNPQIGPSDSHTNEGANGDTHDTHSKNGHRGIHLHRHKHGKAKHEENIEVGEQVSMNTHERGAHKTDEGKEHSSGIALPINREEVMRRRESASKLVDTVSKAIKHTLGMKDDGSLLRRPSTTRIIAPDDPKRNLSDFDALHNFRDLGGLSTEEGYVVKTGLIYRMARPDHMSEADIKQFTDHYHIKTIIDLRRQVEIDRSKADNLVFGKFTESIKHAQRIRISGFLQAEEYEIKLRRFHVNILGSYYLANKIYNVSSKREMIHHGLRDMFGKGPGRTAEKFVSSTLMAEIGIVGNYNDILALCTAQIGVVLKIIATEGNKSVVFHCSHGKDRTGLIAMLVLSVLGVSDADIAKDYAMSSLGLEGMQDVVQNEICGESGLPEEFSGAAEASMLATMNHLRTTYKSVPHYLEKCGFGASWQNKLRALYLDQGTQDGIKATSLTALDTPQIEMNTATTITAHDSVPHAVMAGTKALSINSASQCSGTSDTPKS